MNHLWLTIDAKLLVIVNNEMEKLKIGLRKDIQEGYS